ncbi:hypothetical protein CR513_51980, partial [Mucuna pruriens]
MDMNKSCLKDLYPLPSIDRLVDDASRCDLLNQDVPSRQGQNRIHDVEVYVDDMVVKSAIAGEHCDALRRVFDVLKKHQLKLTQKNAHLEFKLERDRGKFREVSSHHQHEKSKEHNGGATPRRKDNDLGMIPILIEKFLWTEECKAAF